MNWMYALEWERRIMSGQRKWQEKTAIGNKSVWKDTAGQFFREWKDSMDGEVRKASDGHGLGTVWTRHSRLAALNYICLPPRPLTTWRLFFLRSVTASTVHSWARWTHGHMRKLFCSTACDELDNAKDALRTFFGLGEWVWHSAIFLLCRWLAALVKRIRARRTPKGGWTQTYDVSACMITFKALSI